MDAYDIFKKLTKGLKFKHRVLGVKNQVRKNITFVQLLNLISLQSKLKSELFI